MTSPSQQRRRVVITGLGLISPLGNSPEEFWSALSTGQSGVAPCQQFPRGTLPIKFAAEVKQFTGAIDDFGTLPKHRMKAIRKGVKLMCRETQMAIAAAQRALADAGFAEHVPDPELSGVALGSDYMLTMPADYTAGIQKCGSREGNFQFDLWGDEGLGEMTPLWMLKYLPNMPASHIAILNDLRGPNNSLTMREASANLAIGEAFRTIQRGQADRMVAGATGTRVLPMQALHALQTEQMASPDLDPASACRPFDKNRTGMVAGEGAGMVILEEAHVAQSRGASIYAEVVGLGSSSVADGGLQGKCDLALINAMHAALGDAGKLASEIGHICAHGLSTSQRDAEEARAIQQVFGPYAKDIPITAPKSFFGNLGAGSGVVELIASLLALEHGHLPRVLNYTTPDPACLIAAVTDDRTPAGSSFLNLNVTPQGQAAVLCVAAWS